MKHPTSTGPLALTPAPRRVALSRTLACVGVGVALVWLAGCAQPGGGLAAKPNGETSRPSFQYRTPGPEAIAPEASSGRSEKPGWALKRWGVAAANPLATDAGRQVLAAGGSAIDAAIAVQMVLTLVEPQSSGIGGGAFLVHWDGRGLQAYDGRETAPGAATPDLFLLPDGKPMPFQQAVVGGRSVGVPGTVRVLEMAHRAHGRLPWARLFEPAITLANEGFPVSPRLHTLLKAELALRQDPQARAYFYRPDGEPHAVGHHLRNPALAAVLRDIAQRGSVALHEGAVAADVVRRVRQHPSNPGRLSEADMRGYQAVQRDVLCTAWQQRYRVCGMPPPSSGQLTIMQILGMLEHSPSAPKGKDGQTNGLPSPDWLHHYSEAARLAFADRAQYIADPAFVAAPGGRWTSLLEPGYLRERAALIGPRAVSSAAAGNPGGARVAWASQPEQPEYGTSHISIVDAQGRALAMTTTIEAGWGARLMSDGGTGQVGGFLLNNELTDFSLAPADAQGRPIANRVEPGKRPRSSMSPTLVFDAHDGRLLMTAGSPGGAAIIHFTAKTLVGSLAWGLDPQQAINLPNFVNFGQATNLERGRFPAATVQALKDRGHQVGEVELTSGLQALLRTATGWFGGADPRREGVVMGE